VLELRAKLGKTTELSSVVSGKELSILRNEQGFQGEIALVSDTDPNRLLVLSFWGKREDAERYHREQSPPIEEMLRPLCKGEPLFGSNCSNFVPAHRL
jgi:hypothetical protein